MSWLREIRRGLFNGNGIARRTAVAIILFSSCVTAFATAIQIYFEYRSEIGGLRGRFDQIGSTQVPILVNSVWTLDRPQIETQLQSLIRLPNIEYASVSANGAVLGSAGERHSMRVLTKKYPLTRKHRQQIVNIGTLEVTASLDNIYAGLLRMVLVILATNAAKTFLVAIFMLIIFQWIVTRHLYRLADFTRQIDLDKPDPPDVVLDRRPPGRRRIDALDMLQTALNDMRRKVRTANAATKASLQEYLDIFNNSPVGLFRIAPDRSFLAVNPALAHLLGDAGPPETIARVRDVCTQVFIDPSDGQTCLTALTEGNPVGDREVRWRRADGKVIWVVLNARPIPGDDGGSHYFEGSVQDITARRTAAAELMAAKEAADAASRAKSQLLANVSHDLRTPLNAIIGFADIIDRRLLGDGEIDAYRDYAHNISQAGQHQLALVDQLLDISKIEAGSYELHDEDIDLDALLHETLKLFSEAAGKFGVALTIVPDRTGQRLRADPTSIRQIVQNLVSNAIKFTARGGAVQMAAYREPDDGITLAVTDTGIGISQDDISRLAQPFVRGTDAYRRDYPGHGLGLWISRKLAELHGATLSVNSEIGKGTTITVHFPAQRTLPKPPRQAGPAGR